MEALLLVPSEVHGSLLLGAAACSPIPWMKALPSHLGKSEITSCIRAVSSWKMREGDGEWGREGGGGGGGEQVVAADSKHGLQRHSRHISRNITRDNLWCHLADVSLERSPTNNNILLILSTILATSSHPPTHRRTPERRRIEKCLQPCLPNTSMFVCLGPAVVVLNPGRGESGEN